MSVLRRGCCAVGIIVAAALNKVVLRFKLPSFVAAIERVCRRRGSRSIVSSLRSVSFLRVATTWSVIVSMLFAGTPLSAAEFYWDGDGVTGNNNADGTGLGNLGGGPFTWDTTNAFWWNGVNPDTLWNNAASNTAIFTGIAGTVTLSEAITAGGLTFKTSGYTLTGNTLTLAPAAGSSSPLIAVDGIGTQATIESLLAGTSGFTKTGYGSLTLTNNSNSFSGDIAVKSGQLIITNAGQLGTGTTAISITGIAQTGNPGFSGGALVLQGAATSAAGPGITINRQISVSGRGPGVVNNTGGLVSIGYNTLAGGLTLGSTVTDSRVWATHGTTTITGGVDIAVGTTNSGSFQGNGNWTISGIVTGSENSADRFLKLGQIVSTTLWLQNAGNTFTDALRVDSGTVRVQASGALGLNIGTGQIDLNNGTIEIRTDAPAGFAGRTARVRNGTTGNFFVDHDLMGELGIGTSLQNQTVTMGTLIRDAGSSGGNFTFNGRNGYNISFNTSPTAGDYRGITVTNNSSGTVTLNGNVWNANNATASTFTVAGNGETVITGSVVTTAVANVLTKTGTGTFFYGGNAGTYQGATNISAGTLSFSNVGGFGGTSQINIGNATTTSGTLTYTGAADTLSAPINLNTTTANVFINSSGTGALTINGTLSAVAGTSKTLVLGGTNTDLNEIQSSIPLGGTTLNLQKIGVGTWQLSGGNLFTGSTTVSGGTLKIQDTFSGSSRDVLPDAGAIVFNIDSFSQAAGGIFNYIGTASAASAETVGALTAAAGQGTIVATPTGVGGSATLTFGSLGARTTGATVNVLSGGAVNITGTAGFVNSGTYFNGADFAYSGAGTTLRAPVYTDGLGGAGGDVGFITSATALSGALHNEITGSFTSGAAAVNSLRISGARTLTLTGNLTIGVASGSGILQTGGNGKIDGAAGNIVVSAAGNDLAVRVDGSANTLEIARPITTSTAGLTKSGEGTLILSGANTYSGTVNVNQGILQMATGGLLGATNIGLNVRQGATFDLAGINVGTVASGTNSVNALNGAGIITNTGVFATLRVGNNNAGGYFTGDITGANLSLVKSGSGTLSLTSTASSFGNLTISAGTVAFALPAGTTTMNAGTNSPIGFGVDASALVFNGGTLQYTGAGTTIYQSTQSPSISTDREFTLAGNGTIDSSGSFGNGVLARAANSASIIFSSTSNLSFSGAGTRLLTLTGDSIGDNEMRIRLRDNPNALEALSLTKAGGGLWILNPLSSNDYAGTTTISGGALRVAAAAATVQGLSAASPLVINGGVLETSGTFTRNLAAPVAGFGTVQLPGGTSGFSAATTDRLVVTIGGGALTWGSTNFNPTALVLGSTTALGETEITNDIAIGAAVRTVTVNNNGNTGAMVTAGILSGVISGAGTGGNALIKSGGGVLILGNANTYTGSTRVDAGNLVVTSIGTGASSSLGASGALIYNGPGNGDLNALLYVGGGEIANRDLTFQGANFTGNRIYRIDASGSGALIWNSGTFAHTTRGDTVARVLTLDLRGSNTDFNQMNLVLTNSTNATFANVLHIVKSDGGVWVLNPASANTFTGNINANGGLLGLTGNGIGSANAIALNNGGIFAYGGPLITSTQVIGNNSTGVFAGSNAITINANVSKTAGNNQWTLSNSMESGALLTINGDFINLENGTTAATQTISIRGFGSTVWNGSIGENAAAGGKIAWDIRLADGAYFKFDGSNANTYTGTTLLGQGTLILSKDSGVAQFGASSQFSFAGGVLTSDLALTGADKINTKVVLNGDQAMIDGAFDIELAGIVENNAGNRFLRNELDAGKTLTLSGTVNLSNDNTGRTLTLRGSGSTVISGVVANGGTGAGGLAYSGLSTLSLTNSNTATGALTVNRNTVQLSGAGTWAGTVVLNPIGTLTLDNTAGSVNRLADAGAVTGQGGTLAIVGAGGGTTEVTGALTLNSVQTYITTSGGNVDLTFASVTFANSGSSLNLSGVSNLGTNNFVRFTAAPSGAAIVFGPSGLIPRIYLGGTDFAKYDATNGVIALAAGDYNTGNNLNTAAATDTLNLTASSSLTAFRTLNALKINGAGLSVGGSEGTRLTLTSGGLINTAGNNSLDVPTIAFTNTPVIQVAGGTTLTLNSSLIGSTNLIKALPGTLVINAPSYVTGTHNLLNGTTRLIAGGLNTFFPNQLLNINDGATLDLNGGIQYFAQLSDPGILPEAGGLITSSAGAALLVTNMNGGSTTFATNINDGAGTVSLARLGGNTLTLESVNTYSGATTMLGGTLQLQDDATILNTSSIELNAATLTLNNNSSLQRAVYNRIGDSTPITLRDGTITFTGKVSDPSYEIFGALTAAQGANTITSNTGGLGTAGALASADITFASITRAAGTTVNFTGTTLGQQGNSGRIAVTTTLPTVLGGALGAWGIANTTDYAAYNSALGIGVVGQGGFVGYSGTFASGNITELPAVAASTTTLSGYTATGLLRIAGAFTNNIAFTADTDTLNLEQGGILRSNNNNATTIGTSAIRGHLTSGANELIVFSSQSTLTINSFIDGAATTFIKSGAGTVSLTANNTYGGGTSVLQGTLTLNGGIGDVVIPAGGLLVSGATVTMVANAGQIDPSNAVTIRRSSTLTLVGNNTLDSIVFDNNGGTTNPTVTVGGILSLTNSTPVSITTNNAQTLPVISGGTLALGAGAKTFDVGAPNIGGQIYTNISPALSITSVITGTGPITKSNLGLLQLSGASTFSGLNVTGGGIVVGASSTQSVGTVVSGPLGIGAVAMSSGTRLLTAGTFTIGNDVSFAGTPMFDSTATTAWTLTLTGNLTGAGFSGGTPTIEVTNPGLTVALLGNLPAASSYTKTGQGTLIFNATNYTGDFNATALGNPNAISLIHDGDRTGSVQTIAMGSVTFDPGILPNITINRGGSLPFPLAANKILAPSSITNTGLGLTVTNSSGYGLQVSDATAFTGTPTISVGTATASNVTQGLYLKGDLTGTGFLKIGAGTVVLNNATPSNNTFTGNIEIRQGVISVSDDALLGNAANTIQLNPTTGTSTFRATGTFATSRTIDLGTTANTRSIEVTAGNTLTLNSAFGLTAPTAALVKADLGTLVLGASNAGWSGNLTINAGIVSPTAANTLGTGTLIVNEASAALQLSGGLTITNALTIDVLANGRVVTGLNTGGAIQSVTGSNTIGTITVNATPSADNQTRSYGFGADNGATLNIGTVNYNHASTGTSRNIIGYYNTQGTGAINVSGAIDNTNGSPGANTYLFKIGAGMMTLTGANAIPDTEVRVYRGALLLNGAATFGSGATQVQVWQSGTLTLDNSTTNTPNRFSNRVVQIGGGTLNFIPNSGGSSHVSTGALQISQGANTINLASGGNLTVTFASLTQNAGATLNLTGTFGASTNKLTFTTAPTLVPASIGLLARVTTNGNEFATYNATNGIVPFTGYAAATNILSATTTQTFKATTSTLNSLTGNQTLNALTINNTAAVGGLGGNPPSTLTLTSGGILANGSGGAFLNVPIVNFAGVEGVIHVVSGQSLTVNSGMSGTGGLTKDLDGTLNLNAQQFVSGNTYVNGGTLNLVAGATNTLLFNNGLAVNGGATVDLKNGVQFIGSLFSANGGGNTDLGGGIVTNSGVQATLVTNSNSNFNGQINGTIYLNKTGTNSLNLQQANSYSGPTLITGGTLNLADDGTILNTSAIDIYFGTLTMSNGNLRDNADRVNDAAPITMRGGTLNFAGRAQANSSETVGAVTLVEGNNSIFSNDADIGIGSGVLTIASLARSVGSVATLRFNNAGDFGLIGTRGRVMITSAPTLTNNLIGPWAVVDRELASYDATYGVGTLNQVGFAGYSGVSIIGGPTSTDNVRFAVAGTTVLATNTTVGTLTFGQQTTATTLDLGGNTLTIQGGALVFGQGTDNVNFAITSGNLTGPAGGGDLYIHHLNYSGTNRTVSIDAAITDNGGPIRVIKNSGDTGASVMTWNGTNTYTGGTVLNMGTLTLGATSTLGTGGITVYQATLNQTAGAVIPAQTLTLNGPGTVTLAGNNTLTGISITNSGGGTPTITPTGVLTLTGGITSTSANAGAVATIGTGTLDLNGAGAFSINVGAVTVNGQAVAPWQGDLIINSTIQNGGITKSGAGNLQLGGQSTFTGGVTITSGGLVLASDTNSIVLNDPVVTGPVGTGTLTLSGAVTTVVASGGARTITNNVVITGDTIFAGTNNITFNGDTTLPTTWNANVVAPNVVVTIGNVIGSLGTDVVNKSGLGTLSLGNYNGTINIAGGLIFLADGNTLGTVESLALGGNVALTADTAITVNRSGAAPNARNKTLQKVNLTNNGSILAVNNQSGYGLEFTGTTVLTGASHFSVGVATASNLVQGLTLSGVVSDTGGFDLVKSGLGTLALTNSGNTFGGVGKTIDVLNGILAASSDGALGNTNNSITLEVDGTTGVGFRATGSFSTARTFLLNAPNNAFEVTQGNTFTLTTSFSLLSAGNTLTKNDNGVLQIAANNTGWTGAVFVSAGGLRLSDNNAAGSGRVTINAPALGSALQLAGITLANPVTIDVSANNVTASGLDFGGAIQAVSGTNAVSSLITVNGTPSADNTSRNFVLGVDSGATLSIGGGITVNHASGTGRTMTMFLSGAGDGTLSSSITNTAGTPGTFTLLKIGSGKWTIDANMSVPGAVNVSFGTLQLSGAGNLGGTGTITVNAGGTLNIDDSTAAPISHLNNRAVTMQGGTLSYKGNSGTSTETLGVLTAARPGSTIFADSNNGTSTITFASLTQNANSTLNFVSATAALGSANNKIIFTTAPTLTNSLLQRATLNGSDFVTYGANGIAPFATYNAGSTTNINSVTATTGTADVNAVMTTRNLTANRTINAIRLSDPAGVTIGATGAALIAGGNTPAQLALTAGGIIATGAAAHTISVPVLNNAAVEYFFSVDTGSSLNITGAIVGTGGWVKNGPGTLTLTAPSSPIAGRGANTVSGNATINDGTVILNGGNNTLAVTNFIILGPTGTLNLNGNSQMGRLMTDAAVENGGGIITGDASSVLVASYTDDRNFAGSLQGGMSFIRAGNGTLTLYSDNTYSGKTLVAGGALTLRDGARLSNTSTIEINFATLNIDNATSTKDLGDRINDSADITLRGGTLAFLGRAQTASSETVGSVSLARGNSFINSTLGGTGVNSADLTLTGLNRTVGGGTVNFTAATAGQAGSSARILIQAINGVSTAAVGGGLTNGIIGGWAIIGTSDFATYTPGLGVVAMGANGALQYSNATSNPGTLNAAGSTDNISINVAVTGNSLAVSNDLTINSLRIGNIAAQTVNIAAGKTLTLTSGGLLFFSTAGQVIGSSVNQGNLTTTGPELFIYTQGTGPQIINSTITGSGVMLVKSGANGLTLNGTNTYDGGTTINQGAVNLGPLSNIPLAANPLNGLILSGSTLTLSAAGQIASGNIVTLNGPAVLNLVGSNTLSGLIIRNEGGGTATSTVAPTVNSTSGTLLLNGDITTTASTPASTAIINGRVDFGSALRIFDISATRFNGQELAALLSDFNLQGIVGSSGGFVKQGDGVLQFNGQAIYTGPTAVNDGRLQIGATNAGSRFSAYNLATSSTAINLNGVSTILGSLEGAGYIMNSSASTTAQTLTVGYNGNDTTFAGNFLRFNDATPGTTNLAKIGIGVLSLTGNSSTNLGVLTVNQGSVVYKDTGVRSFLTSATLVNQDAVLTLDNSNATSSQNLNNRLGNAGLTLNGGTFNLLGRDATATSETTGTLTLGLGASTINLTPGGTGGTVSMTFAGLTQNAGSTLIVNGTNLGTTSKLLFTTAPTLVPASTGILARIAVGTDFATYAAGTGITAFTGYTVPTDINALAATNTAEITSATTAKTITLARTINAMKITDDNVTIDSTGLLLPTQGLTVTSGGFIVNGNNAVLSTPVVAFAAAEGIFRVNGSSLNIFSSITGTAGITKTGTGSATLSSPQSYTGQTALNLGNLTLAGGDNTILVAPSGTIPVVGDLQVNGGIFDLNGNNQAVRTLLTSNALDFVTGEITNSSTTPVTLIAAMNANSTFGALISGNLSLVRSGNNTLTLSDVATYTGSTTIRGGGLTLQDLASLATSSITLNFGTLTLNNANLNPLAALNPVRFAANTPITMQGATFAIVPGGSVDNTTTVNLVTILPGGANTITPNGVTGGTNTITIGNLVFPANTGTTLHFSTDPGQPTSGGAQVFLSQINGVAPVNNSFLGVNVIINNGEYGVYNTLQGVIRFGGTAISGNTVPAYAAALASGNNLPTNISGTGADVAIAAATTIGALRLTGAATRAITFTNGTATGGPDVLNLALGGLLRDNNNNAANIGTATARGILTSGGTATTGVTELVEWHNQNTVTINSVIADNGLGNLTKFIKAGPGATTLTAANTYTGGTVVNAGTLTINATAGANTVVIPGDLTLNNATLTMSTNGGQIAATSNVTINGSGVLTLTGANTLNSVVFANSGGSATPTVTIGTTSLILSSLTPITSVNDNYSFTPTVAGTLLTLQDGATISASGLSPIDLIISSPISTAAATAPLAKTGAGSLVLSSNTSAFANGFNLNQGSLIFANSSAGTPPTITAGPIGTGTLTLANNVAIMSDGTARTIGNAVSVTQDFTFGTPAAASSRASAGNSLTLSGIVTLAAGAHNIEVNGLLMTGTISGKLTGGTNLTKTGPGTLVLSNAANDYGGNTIISAGTLQLGAAGSIPDTSALVIASGGYLNINGLAETVGSLAGDTPTTGGVITNSGAAATLTIGGDATNTTFAGSITNQANALNLAKSGLGTQVLAGANAYTGTTAVNAGILSIANGTALGTTAAGTTVSAGASLELQAGINVGAEALSIAGTGFNSTGALRNLSGSNTYGGTVTLGSGGATIQSDAGLLTLSAATSIAAAAEALTVTGLGDTTVSGLITGTTATLTKNGAGTLTLSGANTYAGTTTISAGMLSAAILANGGIASGIGAATNAAANLVFDGGTLQYTGATVATDRSFTINTGKTAVFDVSSTATQLTVSGTSAASDGGLTKTGAGTLSLGGSTYLHTGATTVTAGTLNAAPGTTLNGALNVQGTGTFSPGTSSNGDNGNGVGDITIAGATTSTWSNGASFVFDFATTDTGLVGSPTQWDYINFTGAGLSLSTGATYTVSIRSWLGNNYGVNNFNADDPTTISPAVPEGSAFPATYRWLWVNSSALSGDNIDVLGTSTGELNQFVIDTSNLYTPTGVNQPPNYGGHFWVSAYNNDLYINYSSVPEPGSLLLVGLAGLGFAAYRRRKNRSSATTDTNEEQVESA